MNWLCRVIEKGELLGLQWKNIDFDRNTIRVEQQLQRNRSKSGDDIKTVQENLGHHAASFTLDIYGHVSEKMRTQSADRRQQIS